MKKITLSILFTFLVCVVSCPTAAQTVAKEASEPSSISSSGATKNTRSTHEAVATMTQSLAAVTYFEKKKVDAAFAKGAVLFEGNDKYQVHASRRDKAGVVEMHEKDADIMYFLSGTATLVTGGTPLNVTTLGPGETRATDIRGGETRKVGPGDIIIIPAGTPHWFKEVPGPLTYYTVKAR